MAVVAGSSPPRWTLDSQLLLAIRRQDVVRASQLLLAGVDADTRFSINSKKRPALCLCVEGNDLAMVELLLRLGASVNQSDSSGEGPLYLSCCRGHVAVTQAILRHGRVNVNARTIQGTTALHAAASHGSTELVEELLSAGAQVNYQDQCGRSPLHISSTCGHALITQRLIEAGANTALLDSLKNTPLHYAVSRNGIDINNIKELIVRCPQALCITNKYGETPLIIAITSDRADTGDLLEAMLKLAMIIMPNLCHTMILGHRTGRGHTPLHLAVLERQIESIRVLLAAGAEVNTRDHLGHTPLASAARDGTLAAVALLLAAGATTRTLIFYGGLIDGEVKNELIAEQIREATKKPFKLTAVCRRALNRQHGLSGAFHDQLPHRWIDFLNYKVHEL